MVQDPILIGGDGRSGTTLLAAILDSHPDLAVGRELHFRGPPNLGPLMLRGLALLAEGDPRMTTTGVSQEPDLKPALRFIRRAERFGIEPSQLRSLITSAMSETQSDLVEFQDRCVLVGFMGTHLATRNGARRWGFKIMREIRGAPRYLSVWPDSAVLHIVRDGRDVATSQIVDHPSWGYQSLEEAATKWAQLIQKTADLSAKGLIYELRYEDLVSNPEQTLMNLLEFMHAGWDRKVLHHDQSPTLNRSQIRHPSAEGVSQPLGSGSIGRHKYELTGSQISIFNDIAEWALRRHGYLGS